MANNPKENTKPGIEMYVLLYLGVGVFLAIGIAGLKGWHVAADFGKYNCMLLIVLGAAAAIISTWLIWDEKRTTAAKAAPN